MSKRLRVIFVSGNLKLSGSTTWMNAMIEAFQNEGYLVDHLITSEPSKILSAARNIFYTGRERRNIGLRLMRALQLHKVFSKTYRLGAEKYFESRALTLLGEPSEPTLVIKDFSAYIPKCLTGKNFTVVSVMHNFLTDQSKFYYYDKLVTVSKALMNEARGLGFSVDEYIYNPIDISKIKEVSNMYEVRDTEYILFLGKLLKGKGVFNLVDAYHKLVKAREIDRKLIFVGDGQDEEELKNYVEKLGLIDKVLFKGFLSNPFPYVKSADLLVLPSYSEVEVMPYVLIEAGVLGTPYISSDFKGSNEFFNEENIFELAEDTEILISNLSKKIVEVLGAPKSGLAPGVFTQIIPQVVIEKYLSLNKSVIDD